LDKIDRDDWINTLVDLAYMETEMVKILAGPAGSFHTDERDERDLMDAFDYDADMYEADNLEFIGLIYGVSRAEGESDVSYRLRLLNKAETL